MEKFIEVCKQKIKITDQCAEVINSLSKKMTNMDFDSMTQKEQINAYESLSFLQRRSLLAKIYNKLSEEYVGARDCK